MGLGGDIVFLVSPILFFSPLLGWELWAWEGSGEGGKTGKKKKNQLGFIIMKYNVIKYRTSVQQTR